METITMTHAGLKAKHREEMNGFEGIFFAFSNEQFAEGMAKVGLADNETDKIYKLIAGGFILKTRSKAFREMLDRHDAEMKAFRKDQKNLFDALVYELKNHEYCITYDVSDALNALGLTKDDIDTAMLKRACKASLESVNA